MDLLFTITRGQDQDHGMGFSVHLAVAGRHGMQNSTVQEAHTHESMLPSQLSPGQPVRYENIPAWDQYRSLIPLLAMLAPSETSDLE
jgi:putative alpha-1,2-mannosidase